MVIGKINKWSRNVSETRDVNWQSISNINFTLQRERPSYWEINRFTWTQPASYLMSGTRPDVMFPGSELKVFVLDLCSCWPVPADGHFDKSSQLEADVIMVYMETPLPEVPNSEVTVLWFPFCVWVCICKPSQTNKQTIAATTMTELAVVALPFSEEPNHKVICISLETMISLAWKINSKPKSLVCCME